MRPVKQRNRHDPANGVYGDCHRACVASILELPYEEVPHFSDGPDDGRFAERERDFFARWGLVPITVAYNGHATLDQIMLTLKVQCPGVYALLGGSSRNGTNHSVVVLDGEITHDPSIDQSGIVGPCSDGNWWLTFVGHIGATSKGAFARTAERMRYEARARDDKRAAVFYEQQLAEATADAP